MSIEDLTVVGLPEDGEFKVVELYVEDKPILLCGSSGKLHMDILEEYLKSEGIEYATIPVPNYPHQQMPSLEGATYKVVGMGQADIFRMGEHVNFQSPYGYSRDYNIEPDENFKKLIREKFPKEE